MTVHFFLALEWLDRYLVCIFHKFTYILTGDQNALAPVIKHPFTRRADSLTCGAFGSIKTRDFICIQGLDGSLSFFDQDTFIFMCIFNDIIVPAPVCYIANCDSFVICKSTWVLEIYRLEKKRKCDDFHKSYFSLIFYLTTSFNH